MLSRYEKKLKKLYDEIGGSKKGHSYYSVDLKKKKIQKKL